VLLKKVVLLLNRTLWGQFLREICPLKKMTPKYDAASGIIAGELLIETKRFGGIWSFGEHSMGIYYIGGRQIFETSHEVHKRGG
jgi:hypothetical protein